MAEPINDIDAFLDEPFDQKPIDSTNVDEYLDAPTPDIDAFLDEPDDTAPLLQQPPTNEDKSFISKSLGFGKSVGLAALETIAAPFEVTGEAVRMAGQGGEFRLPSIVRNKPFEIIGMGPNKQGLLFGFLPATTKADKPPQDIFAVSASGLQGLNELTQTALANALGYNGGNPLTNADKEIRREKDKLSDLAIQLPLALGTGQAGAAPLTASIRALQKLNPFGKLTGLGKHISKFASKANKTDASFERAIEIGKHVDPKTPMIQRLKDVPVTTADKKEKLIESLNNIRSRIQKLGDDLSAAKSKGDDTLAYGKREQQAVAKIKIMEAELAEKKLINNANLGRFSFEIDKMEKTLKASKEVFNHSRAVKLNKYIDELNVSLAKQKSKLIDLGVRPDQIDNAFVTNFDLSKTFPLAREGALLTKRNTAVSKSMLNTLEASPDIVKTQKDFGNLNFLVDKLDEVSGQGAFRQHLFEPILQGVIDESALTSQAIGRANKFLKANQFTLKESTVLRQYIESGGKLKVPIGREKAFKAAANGYRKLYDELLTAVNNQRKSLGLDAIPKRENYVQHISELNVLDDLGATGDNIKTLMKARSNKPSTPFEMQRMDLLKEEDLAGAIEAFESYASKASRFINQARNADKLRALESAARAMGKPNLSENFRRLADRLTGDSARLSGAGGTEFTGGWYNRTVGKLANKLSSNFAKNVIFGNLGVLVNQVGSQVLASAYIGPRRALMAIPEGLSKNLWEQIIKASGNSQYRTFARQHSKVVQLFEREAVERFSKPDSGITKAMKSLFNYVNDSLVVGTFNQSYKAALSSGRSHADAVKVADMITARAQALYADVLRPSVASSSSKLGQIATPMTTYILNAANMMAQDIAFAKLPASKKMLAATQMAATGILLNLGASALTGKESVSPIDFIPYLRVAQMGVSGALGAAVTGVDAIGSVLSGKPDRGLQKAIETGAIFFNPLGGGLQALKTTKGLREVMDGKSPAPISSILFGPQARRRRK